MVLLWSHWIGCALHYIGIQEIDSESESWLKRNNLIEKDLYVRYIYALYWGVVTMNTVGYGDITPFTVTERLCGVFLLLFACLIFTITFNKLGSAFQEVYEKKMWESYCIFFKKVIIIKNIECLIILQAFEANRTSCY